MDYESLRNHFERDESDEQDGWYHCEHCGCKVFMKRNRQRDALRHLRQCDEFTYF